jgi:hypothetical protein
MFVSHNWFGASREDLAISYRWGSPKSTILGELASSCNNGGTDKIESNGIVAGFTVD